MAYGIQHSTAHINSFTDTVPLCTDTGLPTRIYSFAATVLLHLPVVRQLMSWMGVVSADKQTMLDILAKGSGGALPEGIAGIFTGAARLASAVD